MITYRCEKPYGNLGNRLFQAASIISMAKKFGTDYSIPDWQWNPWLENQIVTGPYVQPDMLVEEITYAYPEGFWEQYEQDFKTKNVGIGNWLQSEKYFDINLVRESFRFTDSFKQSIKDRFPEVFEKPVIAISIRRGDFVGNPNHYLLPVTYYALALMHEFPTWRSHYNLLFFSDDIGYCKLHFECLTNAYFAEGISAIEQLCLGSQCDQFLISNSSFSWWMAWLGEKPDAKIVRPRYIFQGKLLAKNGEAPDYFPSRWIMFDHKDKKFDLKDVTFTIPVHRDHRDREQNVALTVCMLNRDFDTNIIIGEQGGEHFKYMQQWNTYRNFEGMDVFHRTKMLNEMAMQADSQIIVNWDADVFVPPMNLWVAAEHIRNGKDMVYPYDGRFARVPREEWFKPLEKHLDVGIMANHEFKGKNGNPLPISSVGGAIFFNRESFIDGGMENEKMISYAPEDCERYDRFNMLGYRVERIKGCLYHMDHYCGENSLAKRNPFFPSNRDELEKIRLMRKDELRNYVNSWEWVSKYTEGYYEDISEGATRSRDEVFKVLLKNMHIESCIDIGCGIGQWGIGMEELGIKYSGIDYRIPKKKLLIDEYQYAEYDLRSDREFPFSKKHDLVMCLEVAEHIEERYAEKIVKLLCSLGDNVLFSAAIPNQGGRGHVNEQWQTYWAKIFKDYGFSPIVFDEIRWNHQIEIWYRQNIVLYSKRKLFQFPLGMYETSVRPFVLPEMFTNVVSSLKSA